VICSHLFNLLGFLLCVDVPFSAFLNSGDLYGPFQSVEAAFGFAPGAFLLAQLLESRREATSLQIILS
jgi:hypothetical protein